MFAFDKKAVVMLLSVMALTLVLFSTSVLAGITIISPTSSDNWINGGTYDIQFQNPTTCPVNIYLCKTDDPTSQIPIATSDYARTFINKLKLKFNNDI